MRLFTPTHDPYQQPSGAPQLITLVRRCPFCRAVSELAVPLLALQRFRRGESVEECFPSLAPVERELAASGICPDCQAKARPANELPDPPAVTRRCPQTARPERTRGAHVHVAGERRFIGFRDGVAIAEPSVSYADAARAIFPARHPLSDVPITWHPADDETLTFCAPCAATLWLREPELDLRARIEDGPERFHGDVLCDECETTIVDHACAACRAPLRRDGDPPAAYADEGGALHAACLLPLAESGVARPDGPGCWRLDAASGVALPGVYGFPEDV